MHLFRSFSVFFIIILILSNPGSSSYAQEAGVKPGTPLTEADIRDWFLTRIETHKIQLRYKNNADQYDDLVVAYFKGRNEWLRSVGKDPDEWDLLTERVYAVYSMIEEQEDLDREWAEMDQALKEIDENEFLNSDQKDQMKTAMTAVLRKKQEVNHLFVDDWPAAKVYIKEFHELEKWLTGNLEDPPVIK